MAMTLDGTSGITQMTGSIVMSGSTSGTTTIIPSAVAGTTTVTMPASTGTMMVSGNMPAFSAYLNTNQTVSTSTWVKITFNAEEFDTNSNFDSTTNYRFTPTVAGYYQITGCIQGPSSVVGTLIASIYKNGSEFKRGNNINNNTNQVASVASSIIYFNGTTDYVELYTNTGASPISGGSAYTYFSGSMVRSA